MCLFGFTLMFFLCLVIQVSINTSIATPLLRMGKPKSFIFDLGEGYPTYTLFYDCYGHGVSVCVCPARCAPAAWRRCSCVRAEIEIPRGNLEYSNAS